MIKDKVLHLERKFTALTETFIRNQINAISKFTPFVFTVRNLNNLNVKAEVYSSEDYSYLSTKFISNKSVLLFKEKLAQVNPVLIHSHYLTDAAYFHALTKNYLYPKVCSCYGYDVSSFPRKYGRLAKYYFKKIFKEYDLFFAMSEDMRDDLVKLGCPVNKIKIHYHGVETAKFEMDRRYNLTGNCLNLLTIGSLQGRKGHLSVLKSIIKVREKYPNLVLKYSIVGNGFLQEELTLFVQNNSLENIVSFIGYVGQGKAFNEILQNADVFMHPSVTDKGDKEGIPGTIIEAMASGLPVITTYHAGIPSVIEDGVTGTLLKEHDIEGIANKIIEHYDDKLRETIGKNAKKYAREHLDLAKKTRDLEAIYHVLLDSIQ